MNPTNRGQPGDVAAVPNRAAMTTGLRRLQRRLQPRAVATREVAMRRTAGEAPYRNRRVDQEREG